MRKANSVTETTLGLVQAELDKQEEEWGQSNHPLGFWMLILIEEVGEAAKEILEDDIVAASLELVQVAAVAIAAIEDLYRGILDDEN